MATLKDMKVGSEISLVFRIGIEEIVLKSTILAHIETDRHGYGIQCNKPMKDGKYVSCKKNLDRIEIKDLETSRVYKYLKFVLGEIPDNNTIIIASHEDNKPINHRGAFRVPCGFRAKIQCDTNNKAMDGYVHDLSFSGGSCVFGKNQKSPLIDSEISVSMWDDEDDKLHKIKGKIVRVDEDYNRLYKLVGFTIPDFKSVNMIVAKLQRKTLKTRGVDERERSGGN